MNLRVSFRRWREGALSARWPALAWGRPSQPRTSLAGMGFVYGVALGALVLVDALASTPCCSLAPAWVAGLALGLGALLGVLTQGLLLGAARLPRLAVGAAWALCGAGAATWLIDELDSLAKLDGPHSTLALASLAASALLVPLALLLGLSLQRAASGRGFTAAGDYRGWALLATLLVTFGGALWADRNILVALYPALHVALGWLAVVSWLVAATALVAQPRQRRMYRGGLLCVAALGLGIWLTPVASPRQLTELVEAPLPGLVLDTLRTATDFDLDGYSGLLGGGDCQPFDARVHPAAHEVPDNGRDDNCSLGDVTGAQVSFPDEVEIPSAPAPTSVVLITIDTLRADRMGVYGHGRNTTPMIDAWAKQALVFDKAFTSGGWTSIAISSMFRGLYPRRLSWTRLVETSRFRLLRAPEQPTKTERIRATFAMPLDDEHKPLAWWLKRRNMYNTAVVNDGHSQFLSPKFGSAEGFHRYRTLDNLPSSKRNDKHTTQYALEELERVPANRPFFLWVHYFGPHDPTTQHAGVESFGRYLIDRYDHEIRAADVAVGKLLNALTALQQKAPIAIVLAADHGEWFKTKGRQHGRVTPDVTHIPLIVQAEGWPRARYPGVVSLVDVMPTILELTQTPAPSGLDGIPLPRLLDGTRQRSVVLAETWGINRKGRFHSDLVAAIDAEFSLQLDRRKNAWSLFRVTPGTVRDENLLGSIERPELRHALDTFLEANSQLKLSD